MVSDRTDSTEASGELLSVAEAATRLGVSAKTVRRWVKAGKLDAHLEPGPYGEQYRIPANALTSAQEVLDVVKVERPTDPRTLALAVAQAVSQAIEEKQAPLVAELAALRAEVQALREGLANGPPSPQLTSGQGETLPLSIPGQGSPDDDRAGLHQMAHELEKKRPWWWVRDWRKRTRE